jgi:hypothetical protein
MGLGGLAFVAIVNLGNIALWWSKREERHPGAMCITLTAVFLLLGALCQLWAINAHALGWRYAGGWLDTYGMTLTAASFPCLAIGLGRLVTHFEIWRFWSSCAFCGTWGRQYRSEQKTQAETYYGDKTVADKPIWTMVQWKCKACGVGEVRFHGQQFHPGDVEAYRKRVQGAQHGEEAVVI